MDRMATHTKQSEVLQELFEALGNDAFVIAECLARPALTERLLTNWYAYDQRIHGELKQRVKAELQAHNTFEQMRQTSGDYSETELVKDDSEQTVGQAPRLPTNQLAGGAPALQQQDSIRGLKLNAGEWNATVRKLAAAFSHSAVAAGVSPAKVSFGLRRHVAASESADVSAHSKNAPAEASETIPLGKISALQEDETRYYAMTILEIASDRLKLATVSWLKEPVDSWLARAESQMPTAMWAPTASYALPKITEGGCIDDSWTATAGAPSGRGGHTAVWTGSEMIVWGGYPDLNTGGRYNPSTDT